MVPSSSRSPVKLWLLVWRRGEVGKPQMSLNRRLSSFFFSLPLLHIISSAHQQLDKLEWWIWPLWIDTNTWSIKIPDSVIGLRKCATVKDKRSVSALNDIWSCGGKVWGSVFVVLLPGKMCKTLSADRLVQRKVAAKCHHLNAKLKSLLHLPLLICNACFKGAHVQSESCNCYLIADRYKGTVSLNYSHLCSLTLESTEERLGFWVSVSFTHKPTTLCVPPGLHTAVWTDVTPSTSQQPSITFLQWPQTNRSRTRKLPREHQKPFPTHSRTWEVSREKTRLSKWHVAVVLTHH